MTNAAKRYTFEITIAAVLYSAAIFLTGWWARHNPPDTPWIYALALIPAVPAGLMFVAMIRFVRRMDELQQRFVGEAALISACLVGFTSFAYGLLESYADLPSIPMVWILPALFAAYGAAMPFVWARYQ